VSVRIGAGAGYAGDRIDPAVDLADRGELDYLVFECLAERTIALAQLAREDDPDAGYGQLLEERMAAVLPFCDRDGLTVVTNLGAANPLAALRRTREVADSLGLGRVPVAAVTGDDVLDQVVDADAEVWETGRPVRELGDRLVSANAYLGVEALLPALGAGARVVLGGRIADPSLFLAPMVHDLGWDLDDWSRLGSGTTVAHLLECAAQVSGGYFADPGRKDVTDLVDVGFPLAEVDDDAAAVVTKTPGSGGEVSVRTCKEQLLYEIGDPSRYLTPDVTADLSQVTLTPAGPDRVRVAGGTGRARPDDLKVTLGVRAGFIGEGEISYAGPGALDRARLAAAIVEERLRRRGRTDVRIELIGFDATLQGWSSPPATEPTDVRLRVAGRADDARTAARIGEEVEALYLNGPAGGGGAVARHRSVIAAYSTLLPRDAVDLRVHLEDDA
jgi:hypothetical protein